MMMGNLEKIGFTDELIKGDFTEIWGLSIEDIADEIGRLNSLFYGTTDDKLRAKQIREYMGTFELHKLNQIFLPHVNAISHSERKYGSNSIEILGGYVVLSYFIACVYAYDQYCQIYEQENELRYNEFFAALQNIIQNNWVCNRDSPEYRELAVFVKTYSNLVDMSEHQRNIGETNYSLDDYFNTSFQLLILYAYAHELSHIALQHRTSVDSMTALVNDVEADMSAAMFVFTRIKGGWGVESENGKVKATLEPLLRFLEFITKLNPEHMGSRHSQFMRRYLWTATFFDNALEKR